MAFSIKNNPEIEILGTIGDIDPIAYGGGFVCRRREEGAEPWIEYFHGLDGGDDSLDHLILYREDVHVNIWAELDWVEVASVASTVGRGPREFRKAGVSSDLMTRVGVLQDIAAHYGWGELDQYPIPLSLAELCERWGEDVADYMPEDEDEDEDDGDSPMNDVLDDDYDSDME